MLSGSRKTLANASSDELSPPQSQRTTMSLSTSWFRGREAPQAPTEVELLRLFQELLRWVACFEHHFKDLRRIAGAAKSESMAWQQKLQPFVILDGEEAPRAGEKKVEGVMSLMSTDKVKPDGSGVSTDAGGSSSQLVLNDQAAGREEERSSPDQRVVLPDQRGGLVTNELDPTQQTRDVEKRGSQEMSEIGDPRIEGSLSTAPSRQYQELLSLADGFAARYQQMAVEIGEKGGACETWILKVFECHGKLRNFLVQRKLLPKQKVEDLVPKFPEELEGKPVDYDHYVQTVGALLADTADLKIRHEKDLENLISNYRRACNEIDKIREEMAASLRGKDMQIQKLNQHLNMFEQEKAKSQQIGSYLDTSASPPMLDDCVIKLMDKLRRFCRDYDVAHKEARISYQLPEDDGDNIEVVKSIRFARKSHEAKYSTAYAISTAMFRGFEVDGFDTNQGYFCPTLDLEEAQALRFKEFEELKSRPTFQYISELRAKNERSSSEARFLRFLDQKIASITPTHLQHLLQQPDHPYVKSFCLFATWVWLLQRLALSFEPHARIFRVRSGADFDSTYMVNVVDDDADEHEKSTFLPKVGFMVVPGFRVGKIIIKSHVYQQVRTEET